MSRLRKSQHMHSSRIVDNLFLKNSRIKGTTLKKNCFLRIVKAHADTRIRLGIVQCVARNQTTQREVVGLEGHTEGSGVGHLSLLQRGSSLACLQYLDLCSVFRVFSWRKTGSLVVPYGHTIQQDYRSLRTKRRTLTF